MQRRRDGKTEKRENVRSSGVHLAPAGRHVYRISFAPEERYVYRNGDSPKGPRSSGAQCV